MNLTNLDSTFRSTNRTRAATQLSFYEQKRLQDNAQFLVNLPLLGNKKFMLEQRRQSQSIFRRIKQQNLFRASIVENSQDYEYRLPKYSQNRKNLFEAFKNQALSIQKEKKETRNFQQFLKNQTVSIYSSIHCSKDNSFSPKRDSFAKRDSFLENTICSRSKSFSKGKVIFENTMQKPSIKNTTNVSFLSKKYCVQADDIENELSEPDLNDLDDNDLAVNVILEPVKPDRKVIQKHRNPFKCSEYWLSKGYKMQTGRSSNENLNKHLEQRSQFGIKKKIFIADNSDQALDFYQQGLRIDDQMFGCAFNIGCVYLQQVKLRNAKKWFKIARKLNPNSKEAFLGEAISALKLGQQQSCIDIISQTPGQSFTKKSEQAEGTISPCSAVSNEEPVSTNMLVSVELNIDDQFTFLKAICHKRQLNFEQCQKEYSKLEKTFQSRQGFRLAKCVFTNLMLPMQIDRKVVEVHIQQFLEQAQILDYGAFFDKFQYKTLQKIIHFSNKKWVNIEKSILFIRELPLFNRMKISVNQFKDMLPHLRVVEKKLGELNFGDKDHVQIVVNGRVVLRYHEEDPLEYQYLAQYTPGKVLGHPTLDGGVSLLGQVFQTVVSKKCILFEVEREYFETQIWARSKQIMTDLRIKILKQFKLTAELCNQTLYDILLESGEIKLFRPKQFVLACHPRSPMNREARKIYDQEYGFHMKDEVNQEKENSMKDAFKGNNADSAALKNSMVKSSPFGSFLIMAQANKMKREAKGISEEDWIQSKMKPYIYQKGNRAESNLRSLCIILEGSVKVINGVDKFEVYEAFSGSHFGSSDLLKIPDIEYFGDLYAGKKGLKVIVIKRPDQVIQLFERRNIQEVVKGSLDHIKLMIESKYQLNRGDLQDY